MNTRGGGYVFFFSRWCGFFFILTTHVKTICPQGGKTGLVLQMIKSPPPLRGYPIQFHSPGYSIHTHTHTHTHIKCLGCPFPILKYLEINQTKSGNDWRCQKMVKGMYFCRLINSDSDMACVSSSPHGYC